MSWYTECVELLSCPDSKNAGRTRVYELQVIVIGLQARVRGQRVILDASDGAEWFLRSPVASVDYTIATLGRRGGT